MVLKVLQIFFFLGGSRMGSFFFPEIKSLVKSDELLSPRLGSLNVIGDAESQRRDQTLSSAPQEAD